jgi:hypothetical protein
MVFGGLFEVWIVFALIFAALTQGYGRGYLLRVGDALKFQLRGICWASSLTQYNRRSRGILIAMIPRRFM